MLTPIYIISADFVAFYNPKTYNVIAIYKSERSDGFALECRTEEPNVFSDTCGTLIPSPCPDGDIFDLIAYALRKHLDSFPCSFSKWVSSFRFDANLARRLYHFPYFAKYKEKVKVAYKAWKKERLRELEGPDAEASDS